MSLIVCGNKGNDSIGDKDGSLGEAYSFRNDLSSTLVIPKNSQIGLHSVKIQTNGMFVLDGSNEASQFFGEVVDETTETDLSTSTSAPMDWNLTNNFALTSLDAPQPQSVVTDTAENLAVLFQKTANETIWHPNLAQKVQVSVQRDGTSNAFQGFDITYGQDEATANHTPGAGQVYDSAYAEEDVNGNQVRFLYPGGDTTATGWDYFVTGTTGRFLSTAHDPQAVNKDQVNMVATEYPISLMGGELKVDFKDANDDDHNWSIGLSRFIRKNNGFDEFFPGTFTPNGVPSAGTWNDAYADYQVVAYKGELCLFHSVYDKSQGATTYHEIEYWNNNNTDFSALSARYDITSGGNALKLEKVLFTCNGQQIKVTMIDDRGDPKVLYLYDATFAKHANLSPVSQAKWCMFPVLSLETKDTGAGGIGQQLDIEEFSACQGVGVIIPGTAGRQGYRVDKSPFKSEFGIDSVAGWYDWVMSSEGGEDLVMSIESRPWNNYTSPGTPDASAVVINPYMRPPTSGTNRRLGKGTTPSYQNVILTQNNDIYDTDNDLNAGSLLGFRQSPMLTFAEVGTGASDFSVKFSSDITPTMFGSKSLFVRVGGLSQQSLNAFKRNTSTIVGHFPLFDGQANTDRLYYEPNEISYLDLNNAYEIRVSSLDISFCYLNEQFADVLTGQSVVVLVIRDKP